MIFVLSINSCAILANENKYMHFFWGGGGEACYAPGVFVDALFVPTC